MKNFPFHTTDSAPEGSKTLLQSTQDRIGFIPNLFAGMATSPALIEGYTSLSSILVKANLSETERQVILMTNNRLNGCTYCMAAHTTSARKAGVTEDVLQSLRKNTPIDDDKLETLRQFSIAMNEKRGYVTESDLSALYAAGYDQQTVLEVVLATALKVMSNYANHVLHTTTDDQFSADTWQSADTA